MLFNSQFIVSRKEFEEAEEQVKVLEKRLEQARAELKIIEADERAPLREELAVAEKQVREAEGRLKLLLAGSREEEMEVVEAGIQQLSAQQSYLKEQIQLAVVKSPISGVVTTPTTQLREMVGQHLQKGDLIAEVHDLGKVNAQIAFPEKEMADVRLGQGVILEVRAFPQQDFLGTVTAVGTTVTEDEASGWKVVRVTTELDNPFLLKPGMTGKAKILCGKRSLFELLRRRLARTARVEVWSWW